MMRLEDIPVVDDHSHVGLGEYRDKVSVRPLHNELQMFPLQDVRSAVSFEMRRDFLSARRTRGVRTSDLIEAAPDATRIFMKASEGRRTTVNAILPRRVCEELYGVEGATDDFVAASNGARVDGPGALWARMLDLSNTKVILADTPVLDRKLYPLPRFRRTARLDVFLYPFGRPDAYRRGGQVATILDECEQGLRKILSDRGLSVIPRHLGDYMEVVKDGVEDFAKDAASFKVISGYIRSLEFGAPSRGDAEQAYERLAKGERGDYATLEDYIMRHMIGLARDLIKPVQFHTGYGGDAGLKTSNGNPLLLEDLCLDEELRGAKIVVLHGGYPFAAEAACLTHNFHNVYLDFSWMPWMFHHVLARWLGEWLEFLPSNKLLFGADTGVPEIQVTAVRNAKESLGTALTQGMAAGLWSSRDADMIAERVFYANACELYGISLP